MPQPSPPAPLPIIPLDEDEETLYLLLTHIHPPRSQLSSGTVENLDTAVKFLVACNKYFIERPEKTLTEIVYSETLLSEDPARTFALAWMAGLEQRVKHASRFTHYLDLDDPVTRSKLTFSGRMIEPLLVLLDFRYKREVALDRLLEALPLSYFVCATHKNITTVMKSSTVLRTRLRNAVRSPYLLSKGTEEFTKYTNNPQHNTGPLAVTCSFCYGSQLLQPNIGELNLFEKALVGFPCEIEWYACPRSSLRTVTVNDNIDFS